MISLILVLAIIGMLVYVIETYLPITPPIKLLIRVVVVVFVILWLVQAFGLDVPLPKLR